MQVVKNIKLTEIESVNKDSSVPSNHKLPSVGRAPADHSSSYRCSGV